MNTIRFIELQILIYLTLFGIIYLSSSKLISRYPLAITMEYKNIHHS